MKTIVKKLLADAVVTLSEYKSIEDVVTDLEVEGAESLADIKFLDEKQIKTIFALKPIQAKKLLNFIKSYSTEPKKKKIDIKLPPMPSNLSTIGTIEVTGNKNVDLKSIVSFVEFGIMYGLGTEVIGDKLIKLLSSRMEELDEPASASMIKAYTTVAKFASFDTNISAVLDFNLSLLPKRHGMAKEITESMMPVIVEFMNEAMDFRLEVGDINTLLLKKALNSAKVSSDVSADTLVIAAEELAMRVAGNLRGLNSMIVAESLKLYKELFELINDSELQKFLGANDTRDMLIKLGVKYTPKDVAAFQKLPELVYQMLYVLKTPDYLEDDKVLYTYLQNVWSNAKLINWAKFGELKSTHSQCIATEKILVTEDTL